MAFIDYGAIAFKNGKCIQNSFFMDMKESIGRSIDGIDGNYFSYIGDSDLVIAFYKCQMVIFTDTLVDKVYFNCSNSITDKLLISCFCRSNSYISFRFRKDKDRFFLPLRLF